jgi:hypothetical protein
MFQRTRNAHITVDSLKNSLIQIFHMMIYVFIFLNVKLSRLTALLLQFGFTPAGDI